MTTILKRETVQKLRDEIEANPGSAHAWDGRRLLAKWRDEPGLQMDAETRRLLEETVQTYPPLQ